MKDFNLYNPNRYFFGKSALSNLQTEVQKLGSKVMLTYGGGSIKRNGTYEKVLAGLQNCEIREFGGIEPNPRIETLRKGIEIAREFKPDVILAVGGGSVIDGSKLIAAATNYDGDAWDIIAKKPIDISNVIPLACVLTLAATGSEMNGGSVVTKWETNEKDYFSGDKFIPVFTIVDPQVMYSVPADQTAYGIVDAYSHVLEQYMTTNNEMPLSDRFWEGILQTLIEWGPIAIAEPNNYDARANVAFCATFALNSLIPVGGVEDWVTHNIEHVFSGFYDIPHGAGLAIIHPRYLEHIAIEKKLTKMAQYGKRVFGLEGTDQEVAKQAAQKTYDFFKSLNIKMRFSEWQIQQDDLPKIVDRLKGKLGGDVEITDNELETLLKACL